MFELRDRQPWMDDAACADVDEALFFPERGASTAPAKRICASCPVRPQCAEFAIAESINFGIWGGMSERERRNVRRARQEVVA